MSGLIVHTLLHRSLSTAEQRIYVCRVVHPANVFTLQTSPTRYYKRLQRPTLHHSTSHSKVWVFPVTKSGRFCVKLVGCRSVDLGMIKNGQRALLAPPQNAVHFVFVRQNITQSESDAISMLGISSSSSSSSCTVLVASSAVPKCDPSLAVTTPLINGGGTSSARGRHNVSFEYKRPVLGICAGEETLSICEGAGVSLGSGGTLSCGCNGGCCKGAGAGVLGLSTLDNVSGFE